ncbi:MAG: alanine racemase [Oscillospiraceae bacterium]|jgi:alanine racemase|nr:alanine racemase [Oscillospiraceae bacterium]
MLSQPLGGAWQEIDLDALHFNLESVRAAIGPDVKIAAVVKADAYGHGIIECARVLYESGADVIATASVREALYLRKTLPDAPLWAMGYASDDLLENAVVNNIALSISGAEQAKRLSALAESHNTLSHVHLKIDTGFHRLGMSVEDADVALPAIMSTPRLAIDGIFTHLALIDKEHDCAQMIKLFNIIRSSAARLAKELPCLHAADSIAAFRYPEWRLGMIRIGALLYGNHIADAPFTPRKVMRLCARIVSLRSISAGEGVGYDESYRSTRATVIATIPLGYADGLPRRLRESGQAAVRGTRVRYAGLPCMDQSMLDVTDVAGVSVGDAVTVLGGEGADSISVEAFAAWVGSNRNEPLAMTGRRVPRVYYQGGVVKVVDPLLD